MNKNNRRCVSCRKIAPKSEFWRVVKCHPSKEIKIDLDNTILQGRSAYLCRINSCWQVARRKNQLGKSLRSPIKDDIYQQLDCLFK